MLFLYTGPPDRLVGARFSHGKGRTGHAKGRAGKHERGASGEQMFGNDSMYIIRNSDLYTGGC